MFSRLDGDAKARELKRQESRGDDTAWALYRTESQFTADNIADAQRVARLTENAQLNEMVQRPEIGPYVLLARLNFAECNNWDDYVILLESESDAKRCLSKISLDLSKLKKKNKQRRATGLTQGMANNLGHCRAYWKGVITLHTQLRALGSSFADYCNTQADALLAQSKTYEGPWCDYMVAETTELFRELTAQDRADRRRQLAEGRNPKEVKAHFAQLCVDRRDERKKNLAASIDESKLRSVRYPPKFALDSTTLGDLSRTPVRLPEIFRAMIPRVVTSFNETRTVEEFLRLGLAADPTAIVAQAEIEARLFNTQLNAAGAPTNVGAGRGSNDRQPFRPPMGPPRSLTTEYGTPARGRVSAQHERRRDLPTQRSLPSDAGFDLSRAVVHGFVSPFPGSRPQQMAGDQGAGLHPFRRDSVVHFPGQGFQYETGANTRSRLQGLHQPRNIYSTPGTRPWAVPTETAADAQATTTETVPQTGNEGE